MGTERPVHTFLPRTGLHWTYPRDRKRAHELDVRVADVEMTDSGDSVSAVVAQEHWREVDRLLGNHGGQVEGPRSEDYAAPQRSSLDSRRGGRSRTSSPTK